MAELYPSGQLKKMAESMEDEDEISEDEIQPEIEKPIKNIRFSDSSSQKRSQNSSGISSDSQLNWVVVIGIIVCFFACCMYFVLGTDQVLVSCSASFDDVKYQLKSLRKRFPSQDLSLWASVVSGLENLTKKPAEPAVFLLTFDEDSITSWSCIAEAITTLATKLIPPCETRKWLLLDGASLSKSRSNSGDLVDAIMRANDLSQIVIVPDVQKIPAKLAKGFHALVDTYGNVARGRSSVYIFTLMIPRRTNSSTITKVVEDILLQTWNELDKDELQPLVTRISNAILPVTKEEGIQSCPLRIASTVDVNIP